MVCGPVLQLPTLQLPAPLCSSCRYQADTNKCEVWWVLATTFRVLSGQATRNLDMISIV